MRIFSGIDEAGLGPKIGSLFVVGVDVIGDLSGLKESKEIFRRNIKGYSYAESLVLSSLAQMGYEFTNLYGLFLKIFGKTDEIFKNVDIPAFGGEIIRLPFKVISLVPMRLEASKLRKNRFLEDAKAICKIADGLKGNTVVAGLAGGFRDYGRFLKGWEVLERGVYKKGEKILRFERDVDKRYKEVALASLFAKYFRELEMLSLNRFLGFENKIPKFSGYPSDKNTQTLISLLKSKGLEHYIR